MIDGIIIAKIFAIYCGLWALGYAAGKSVAWMRNISSAA